jgi:hypothetical protein
MFICALVPISGGQDRFTMINRIRSRVDPSRSGEPNDNQESLTPETPKSGRSGSRVRNIAAIVGLAGVAMYLRRRRSRSRPKAASEATEATEDTGRGGGSTLRKLGLMVLSTAVIALLRRRIRRMRS